MRAKILNNFTQAKHPKDYRFIDISNKIYGRLTVISYAGLPNYRWNCVCICGNKVAIAAGHLKNGETQSCGCLHKELTIKASSTHGESGINTTPEYRSYCLAKARCMNPFDHAFSNYGKRGIEFRFQSYEDFIKAVGKKPNSTYSLNRINNNGHYEFGNVEWTTQKQQMRNTRANRWITINEVTKCQAEWAEIYNTTTKRIHSRRKQGWCDQCAVILPLFSHKCNHKSTS